MEKGKAKVLDKHDKTEWIYAINMKKDWIKKAWVSCFCLSKTTLALMA